MPTWDKEKQRVYAKEHYRRNREVYLKRARVWYEEHREHCIERETKRNQTLEGLKRRRGYYHKNAAFYIQKTNEWRKNNPEKFRWSYRLYVERRRARILNAPGNFTTVDWLHKVEYHGWKCAYCRVGLTQKSLTIDHKIPLSKGGSNWLANLIPACRTCNSKKGAKSWREYVRYTESNNNRNAL